MGSRRALFATAVAGVALAAACGTRLPDSAFVQTGGGATASTIAGGTAIGPGAPTPGVTTSPGAETGAPGGSASPVGGPAASTPGATTPDGAAAPNGDGGAAAQQGPNQASDVGVTETSINIGTIVAENGVLGDAFAPSARGLRAWVEYINHNGGINGRTINLFTCDDREDRARALECAHTLVEDDQVFALLATNTRAFGGAAPYLAQVGLPVIGNPITNSMYRYPNEWSIYGDWYPRDGNTVGWNGNLQLQTGIFRWFKQNLNLTKAAVFAYDIPESAQAADAFIQGLKLEGYDVTRYDVSFAAPAFDQPVADMQRNGTQIIFDAMDDGANRRLCDAMARRNFSVQAKVSTIVAMGASVGTDFPDACRNSIYISGSSLPYTDTAVPAIATFNQAMATYQPGVELHQWALEAWAMGTMLRDYLTEAGPAPTRAGFNQWIGGLDGYTADGIMIDLSFKQVDYNQSTLPECITIARWQDAAPGGWVSATDPNPTCYPDSYNYGSPVRENGD